jgi:hypothetical protein
MSWTSIVELNHDFAADIERDPQAFVDALLACLRGGRTGSVPAGYVVMSLYRGGDGTYDEWVAFRDKVVGRRRRQLEGLDRLARLSQEMGLYDVPSEKGGGQG